MIKKINRITAGRIIRKAFHLSRSQYRKYLRNARHFIKLYKETGGEWYKSAETYSKHYKIKKPVAILYSLSKEEKEERQSSIRRIKAGSPRRKRVFRNVKLPGKKRQDYTIRIGSYQELCLYHFYGLFYKNEVAFSLYLLANEGKMEWYEAHDYLCKIGEKIGFARTFLHKPSDPEFIDELLDYYGMNKHVDEVEKEESDDEPNHKNHFIPLDDYPHKKFINVGTYFLRYFALLSRAAELNYIPNLKETKLAANKLISR